MIRLLPIFVILHIAVFPVGAFSKSGSNGVICDNFVRPKGFTCEEYKVTTDDLFVLSLQRVSSPNSSTKLDAGPIFLYHGIMQGGEIWLINEAKMSLGFILADAGFDVWIGNTRSSDFSAGHLLYTPSQQEYWEWNFDDIVAQDVPTMLRFIVNDTNKRVLFVGFSQGSMAGIAAFTNRKISMMVDKAVMLGPIAFLSNIRSLVARVASSLFLDQVDLALGVTRFSLSDNLVRQILNLARQILNLACDNTDSNCLEGLLTSIEVNILFEIGYMYGTGPSCCINQSRIPYYQKYELQSTSMKNIVQLAQMVRSGRFCKYDHGILGNFFHYFTFTAPSYKVQRLPEEMEILLVFGGNDYLADTADVMRLKSKIPGKVKMLYMPTYSHGDFVLGADAHIDVYPAVLRFFNDTY